MRYFCVSVHLRIAYTNYDQAVIYICPTMDVHGHCDPISIQILLLARNKTIDYSSRKMMANVVGKLCTHPETLINNSYYQGM